MAKKRFIESLEELFTKNGSKSVLRYQAPDNKWRYIVGSTSDVSTTLDAMATSDISTGTSTTAMSIAPKTLRDNFYTEGEIDTMIGNIETLLAAI